MERRARLAKHFIYYLATTVFFFIGAITTANLDWYRTLSLPEWMLPDMIIALIWGVLVSLTVLSVSLFRDVRERPAGQRATLRLYGLNACLVLVWNITFFGFHYLDAASVVAVLVALSILALMVRVRRAAPHAAWLLAPYLAWVLYAIYLHHSLSAIN